MPGLAAPPAESKTVYTESEKTTMGILELLKKQQVYLDGGMGTLLQDRGLRPGESPESWNLSHPEDVIAIHRAYFDAGSNVVCTNTFGANPLRFESGWLEKVVSAALDNVRAARDSSVGKQEKYVALDIGPSGRLLKPYGDLDFEDAVAAFAETVRLGVKYGADLILIETMNDSYETKAALLAAKENSDLPVFVSNAYGEDGKLMTGATRRPWWPFWRAWGPTPSASTAPWVPGPWLRWCGSTCAGPPCRCC